MLILIRINVLQSNDLVQSFLTKETKLVTDCFGSYIYFNEYDTNRNIKLILSTEREVTTELVFVE